MSDEDAAYPKQASGAPIALEAREQAEDGRRYSPSIGRNKDAVREAFLAHMPSVGRVLEIASGTGEHGYHITAAAPELSWTYSDIDPESLISQAAWAQAAAHDRLLGPVNVDVTAAHWGDIEPSDPYDGVFCANMIHIAPLVVAEGLFAGAARILRPGGRLALYGPFARAGVIAPSNQRFSEDLKRRDPDWGVRDLDLTIAPLAERCGVRLEQVTPMPANNLFVVFERDAT